MMLNRQQELEVIEVRARLFVNAYLRKEIGNDTRNRNVDTDLEVTLVALLEALGTDPSSYLRSKTDVSEKTSLQTS